MSRILLYFGSFNPLHRGHTSIVRCAMSNDICDELWIVVSPQSPLKSRDGIIDGEDRLRMVELALEEEELCSQVKVCRVEFELPMPSYTVDTLRELTARFPDDNFSILMGGDNQYGFEKWKEWSYIEANYDIYVYPRPGFCDNREYKNKRFKILHDAPLMEINATEIRRSLASGLDAHKWLHRSTAMYIKNRGLWM